MFDGHGGGEVAKYCNLHFGDILMQNNLYSKKNMIETGLRETFMNVDVELDKPAGHEEIAEMKKANPPHKSPLLHILGETMDSMKNKDGGEGGKPGANPLGGGEENGAEGVGCTANVIMIDDNKRLIIANSGDSRSVLCRGGKAVELSFDHKPDNEIEKNRIEKAGSTITAGRVDGNLNLSRALGDLRYKRKEGIPPEEQPITANPDVRVVDLDTK